jgi:RsiW-degrading membrane proteinase PrsW (M82 family)
MPIPVACSGCGKRFKAPDRGAGKQVPCPACQAIISIPVPVIDVEQDDYRLADEPPSVAASASTPRVLAPAVSAETAPAIAAKAWVPPTKSSTPGWLRHLHWCLALAMLPLAVSIFMPERPEIGVAQVADEPVAGDRAAGEQSAGTPRAEQPSPNSNEPSATDDAQMNETLSQMSVDDLFAALPGHKLPGALLTRHSHLHWLFALFAAAIYMTFLLLLASDKAAQPLHLLGIGLFTATGGIILLLLVQALSQIGVVRVGGIIGLVLIVLALIGLSYSVALHPDSGFIVSFLGFTCGVGLCEEVCKALPILIYYRIGNQQSWRGAFLWGLASGTGFGVSEGVMYSQEYYNGIAGPGIYLVRFVSCVALHAVWAGSVGISINQRQYLLQEDHEDWWMYALAVLQMVAIPMALHGLYDTLLKKDMEFLALVTAAASFGYLAWQISHLRTSDDEDERAAYVARYIRGKLASRA